MKRKFFNFKLFHYYWLIHLFLIDLKRHAFHLKFFLFLVLRIYLSIQQSNITLYLLNDSIIHVDALSGLNFLVLSFFKAVQLFLNIHTSIWILELACQNPIKTDQFIDWSWIYRFIEGLRGSKNINFNVMALRKCALTNRLSGPLLPNVSWGPVPCVWLRVTQSPGAPPGGAVGPFLGPRILVWKDWFQHRHILKCTEHQLKHLGPVLRWPGTSNKPLALEQGMGPRAAKSRQPQPREDGLWGQLWRRGQLPAGQGEDGGVNRKREMGCLCWKEGQLVMRSLCTRAWHRGPPGHCMPCRGCPGQAPGKPGVGGRRSGWSVLSMGVGIGGDWLGQPRGNESMF